MAWPVVRKSAATARAQPLSRSHARSATARRKLSVARAVIQAITNGATTQTMMRLPSERRSPGASSGGVIGGVQPQLLHDRIDLHRVMSHGWCRSAVARNRNGHRGLRPGWPKTPDWPIGFLGIRTATRWHPRCQWIVVMPSTSCGLRATDVDHIVPEVRGGSDEAVDPQHLCAVHHRIKTPRWNVAGPADRRGPASGPAGPFAPRVRRGCRGRR